MDILTSLAFWETLLFIGVPAWVAVSQLFYWICVLIGVLKGDARRRMKKFLDVANTVVAVLAAIALVMFIGDIGMNTSLAVTLGIILLALIAALGGVHAWRSAKPTNL